MSKYTTEVRYICEFLSGYKESAPYKSIDDVIEKSWKEIFDFSFPIFDEEYKAVLCQKILLHFYTREIGYETTARWKLGLRTKLNEIMPKYNRLYKSELYKIDALASYYHERETTNDRTAEGNSVTQGSGDSTNWDLYSDTPQGALTGVENGDYLSAAQKQTNKSSSKSNTTSNDSSLDKYIEKAKGFDGDLVSKLSNYRDNWVDIDLMIINELETEFMQIW